MKDFDIYVLVVGLLLLAGYVSASGVNELTALASQVEYFVFAGIAFFLTLAGVLFKLYSKRSTNNH